MHYLANVPGIEHILAIKVLMPMVGGGGGGPGICTIWLMSQKGAHVAYILISIMHYSLPAISLLTCCEKEVLKYSQAARHSGILPPPPAPFWA